MSQSSLFQIADTRFEDILRAEGISLQQYRPLLPSVFLFRNATTYPQFFNQNLVSPYRIIKQFINDPHSNIRALYFQLLRLSYEVEPNNPDYRGFIIHLRRLVFAEDFQIMFTPDTENQRDIYSDFQFKKFFAEFLVLIETESKVLLVEQIISKYPIIDLVFIHIFRSLLAARGINEPFEMNIQTEMVFGEFAEPLGLNITSYGNCWKFEDSDMFCFEEDESRLYLAYIVEGGEGLAHSHTPQGNTATVTVHDNLRLGAVPTETFASITITQTTPTTYLNTTFGNTSIEPINYTAISDTIPAYTTQTITYSNPSVDKSSTSGYDVVTTSINPVETNYDYSYKSQSVSYDPVGYTKTTTYETPVFETTTTSYTPYTTTNYETTTASYTPYTATSYETTTAYPIERARTAETYTSNYTPSSYSYSSPVDTITTTYQPTTTAYETKTYTATNYDTGIDNDLVNKYLSGGNAIGSSSYTSSYTPSSYDPLSYTSTKVAAVDSDTKNVEYISYTNVTTPIEVVGNATTVTTATNYTPSSTTPAATTNYGTGLYGTTGTATSYGNYTLPTASSYTTATPSYYTSSYSYEPVTTTPIGGGYLDSLSTTTNYSSSNTSYQPSTTSYSSSTTYGTTTPIDYTTPISTTSYSSANYGLSIQPKYKQYGQFKDDFSSSDILSIMRKGNTSSVSSSNNISSSSNLNLTTLTPTGGVTQTYSTGPVTAVIPGGVSTYEYSSSYAVEPVSGVVGYSVQENERSYSVGGGYGGY